MSDRIGRAAMCIGRTGCSCDVCISAEILAAYVSVMSPLIERLREALAGAMTVEAATAQVSALLAADAAARGVP